MIEDKGFVYGVIFVSLVGFLCYVNTFKAQFVYDDNRAILENPDILQSTPWSNVWQNDFWGTPLSHSGSHKSYRPLTVLSFKLNHITGQLDPKSYHVTNVVLHGVASGLVFALAFTLFGSTHQSLLAGLLFAVHPIHTEAVAGVVGRADILSCIFFVLSVISYTKASRFAFTLSSAYSPTNWKYFVLAVFFSVAAMLSKEIGITALAICLVYEVVFTIEPELKKLKETLWRAKARGSLSRISCLLLAATVAVYWRLFIMDLSVPEFNDSDNPASVHPNFIVRFLTFSYLPVLNFYLLLFPWQLSFDWSMGAIDLIASFKDARNLESFIFYSFLLIISFKFLRSRFSQPCNYAADSSSSASSGTLRSSKKKRQESTCSLIGSSSHSFLSLCYFKLNCLVARNGSSLWTIDVDNCFKSNRNAQLLRENSTRNGLKKNAESLKFYEDSSQSDSDASRYHVSKHQNTTSTRSKHQHCKTRLNSCPVNGLMGAEKSNDNHLNSYGILDKFESTTNLYQDFDLALFSLAVTVISFIPASNVFFYVGFVIAERVLYIPSIGFCLLVTVGFSHVWNAARRYRPILLAAFIILIGLFSIRTIIRNEDWENEESLYRSGIRINPAKAWSNLGNVLSQQGKLDEAELAYRRALEVRPNMADAYYNLGILLQGAKRFKEAIECYKNAIHYRSRLASAFLNLGLVYDEMGDKTQALEIFQRGRNLSDHGLKNPKAHHHALTSIAHNIGKILFDMGKYKESIAVFLDAIDKMAVTYAPHSLYNMLGQSYSFSGDKDRAEYWYLKSLKSNGSHVPSHLTYARHLASIGKLKEAKVWFLKAIKLQPENPQSYFHYAEFLYNNDRLEESLIAIEKAVMLNPNDTHAVLFAASCFREAKKYPQAEEYYRKAVELNPDDSSCHMNLGALLHLTGRLNEAKASYLEAIRLDPEDELTLDNLRKLESKQARINGGK